MPKQEGKYQRRADPLYAKLKGSAKFIDSVMSETGLNPAVQADDPLERSLPGAAVRAEVRQRPLAQRKEAAYAERQEARTPAAKAAKGVLADVAGESEQDTQPKHSADERVAQAKALVAEWDADDRAAIRDALQDAEIDELGADAFAATYPGDSEDEEDDDVDALARDDFGDQDGFAWDEDDDSGEAEAA